MLYQHYGIFTVFVYNMFYSSCYQFITDLILYYYHMKVIYHIFPTYYIIMMSSQTISSDMKYNYNKYFVPVL